MPAKPKKKNTAKNTTDDWFEALDAELEQKAKEISKKFVMQSTRKAELNKELIEDFWKIWLRFNKINVHFSIEPNHSLFAQFAEFPDIWQMRETFDYGSVNLIELMDRTRDQGRVGDSLKVNYYTVDETLHMRMVFEYCEGEHYYKYAGWKRIFSQYVLYDAPLDKVKMEEVHRILAGVIKAWYESHLKKDREIILNYIKKNFEKGESFTQ